MSLEHDGIERQLHTIGLALTVLAISKVMDFFPDECTESDQEALTELSEWRTRELFLLKEMGVCKRSWVEEAAKRKKESGD